VGAAASMAVVTVDKPCRPTKSPTQCDVGNFASGGVKLRQSTPYGKSADRAQRLGSLIRTWIAAACILLRGRGGEARKTSPPIPHWHIGYGRPTGFAHPDSAQYRIDEVRVTETCCEVGCFVFCVTQILLAQQAVVTRLCDSRTGRRPTVRLQAAAGWRWCTGQDIS